MSTDVTFTTRLKDGTKVNAGATVTPEGPDFRYASIRFGFIEYADTGEDVPGKVFRENSDHLQEEAMNADPV